jgi:hypothetical protein
VILRAEIANLAPLILAGFGAARSWRFVGVAPLRLGMMRV